MLPLIALRKNPALTLSSFWWWILGFLWLRPALLQSLPLSSLGLAFSVSLSTFPSSAKATSHWIIFHSNPVWDFFGRNDAKAETPALWPPHAKSWLIGKDSDAGRDWGQEEKGTTEDEMAGWHLRLDGHESEWTPGVGDGQGGLACCDSWGHKELDMTERLNWTELYWWSHCHLLCCFGFEFIHPFCVSYLENFL